MKISPKYDGSKLRTPSIDDFIDVFEDRLFGWHLNWAHHLKNDEHAGFAVLHLCFSYFELIYSYKNGEDTKASTSKKAFKESFLDVFSYLKNEYDELILKVAIELVYQNGRNGFYHSGMAKKRIHIQDGDKAISFEVIGSNVISAKVDRNKFVELIIEHAHSYIRAIRNENEITQRENFIKAWNIFHE